jgi:hypothetical protein
VCVFGLLDESAASAFRSIGWLSGFWDTRSVDEMVPVEVVGAAIQGVAGLRALCAKKSHSFLSPRSMDPHEDLHTGKQAVIGQTVCFGGRVQSTRFLPPLYRVFLLCKGELAAVAKEGNIFWGLCGFPCQPLDDDVAT